jgi:hypothetical protein
MPTISTFFGIVIRMFYQDYPPAHFHAEYQGQQGKFGFDGVMTVGNIRSRTALRLIRSGPSSTEANSRRTGRGHARGRRLME